MKPRRSAQTPSAAGWHGVCVSHDVPTPGAGHSLNGDGYSNNSTDPAVVQSNPERNVIDEIDLLVDASIARGPTDDYTRPWAQRCELCHGVWHGLPVGLCPGAHATDSDRDSFLSVRSENHVALQRLRAHRDQTSQRCIPHADPAASNVDVVAALWGSPTADDTTVTDARCDPSAGIPTTSDYICDAIEALIHAASITVRRWRL